MSCAVHASRFLLQDSPAPSASPDLLPVSRSQCRVLHTCRGFTQPLIDLKQRITEAHASLPPENPGKCTPACPCEPGTAGKTTSLRGARSCLCTPCALTCLTARPLQGPSGLRPLWAACGTGGASPPKSSPCSASFARRRVRRRFGSGPSSSSSSESSSTRSSRHQAAAAAARQLHREQQRGRWRERRKQRRQPQQEQERQRMRRESS